MEPLLLTAIIPLIIVLLVILRDINHIRQDVETQEYLTHLASVFTHSPLRLKTDWQDNTTRQLENDEYIVRQDLSAKDGAPTSMTIVVSQKRGKGSREVLRFVLLGDKLQSVTLHGEDTPLDGSVAFLAKTLLGEIDRAVAWKQSVVRHQQQ